MLYDIWFCYSLSSQLEALSRLAQAMPAHTKLPPLHMLPFMNKLRRARH